MNLKKIYKKRNNWAKKGDFGYVLIVGGSKRYSGSPIFNAVCALAALRGGADLTTIVAPKRAADIAASFLPDLITYPLDDELKPGYVKEIIKLSEDFDSLVIGGGIKRGPKAHQAIIEIIKKINLPMVIDAEAIHAVSKQKSVLKNKRAIITPHSGEFKVLTGEVIKDNINDRKNKVKKWARKLGVVLLLKGNVDVISDGKKVVLNKTGSPFMTKGGFGDCLAGICGALLARGVKPLEAASAGAYINGQAGELAAKKFGEGLLASDIFEYIPKVIKFK